MNRYYDSVYAGRRAPETSATAGATSFSEDCGIQYLCGLRRLPVRERNEIILLPLRQIDSVVADDELLCITTANDEHHSTNYRLIFGLTVEYFIDDEIVVQVRVTK